MSTPLPEVLCHTCDMDEQYTADQMRAYGAAEYRRAILDAMNATGAFGKTGEVIAMVIRQLGATP